MPKGKSIYATYFESGASTGKYESSLQRVADVWTKIDFSKEKSAWKDEKRERLLDTILAGTELVSTIGGGMGGFKEGSSALSAETGSDPVKIGRGGKEWGELSDWDRLWQSPRYQFGDDLIMSKSQIREYGRDVKDYGKLGVKLPTDIYKGESMHAEYRAGYDPEKSLGVAKKVAQTIVPGGEDGYKDLYNGIGKKASKSQSVDLSIDSTVKSDDAPAGGETVEVFSDIEGGPSALGQLFKYNLSGEAASIDKMAKMMEIYKNKPKGGWNPEGEKWYDSERAGEFGWTGSRWEN